MFGLKRDLQYSGRNCHKHVEKLLRRGRELLIVSPYIDDHYAKFLVGQRGKRIRIISSSIESKALRRLGKGRPLSGFILIVASILAMNYAASLLGIPEYPFISASALAVIIAYAMLRKGGRNITIRSPRGFIHAKMYISEKAAITGSANLTFRGMHGNIEHIELTHDKGKMRELRREFERLWNL